MEVISTQKRGPQTIYTVKEGDRILTIDRANLPQDVFQRWRNRQAAECMRRKRAKAKEQQHQVENADTELTNPPLDLTSAPDEAGTSKQDQQVSAAAQRALNMIMCKICSVEEVKKILMPCGHLVVCSKCLTIAMSQRAVCPYCRTPIKDHFGAFMVE